MYDTEQLRKDCEILEIDDAKSITKQYVTTKYRKLAKQRHPDRDGGTKEEFQVLQNAYKRVIRHLESGEKDEVDTETDFFMKNNVNKECSSSYVLYIQEELVKKWRTVLEKHLTFHKMDNIRIIFKDGSITITLYEKPKKDP